MTVTSTVSRSTYAAVGAETSIAVPFQVERTGDLKVYRTQTGGSATLLTYGTHYTIPSAQLGSPTCTIALVTPATAGDIFQLRRVLPVLQDLDLRNQGSYQPETLEQQLDRTIEMIQSTNEDISWLSAGTGGSFVFATVTAATLPVADATNVGRVYLVRDPGVEDVFKVSLRLAGGTFAWLEVNRAAGNNAFLSTIAVAGASTLTGGIVGGIPRNVGTWSAPSSAPTGANKQPVTTEMYVGSIFVPANMTVTGIQFLHGTAVPVAQKVIVALYSAVGTRVAQSVAGGTTMTGSASITQRVAFTAPYVAVGPGWYFIGLMFDTATANLVAVIPVAADGGSGVVGSAVTGLTAVTPPSSITVPTTFPASAVVPIASIY